MTAEVTEPDVTVAWTTTQIKAALAAKFPLPEYALFFEVPDSTGYGKCRTADALAMSCWPSRGLDLTGFEIKASRTDWLKEKQNPAKAESICQFCDFWYVVVGSRKIVRDGELPPTWGLIEPRGSKLVVTKEAPRLSPVPVNRNFLASVLRKACESGADQRVIDEQIRRARAEGHAEGKRQNSDQGEATRLRDELNKLRAVLTDFQTMSGLRIDSWTNGKALGEAVRFVLRGGIRDHEAAMQRAQQAARDIDRVFAAWKAAEEAAKPGAT